VAPRCHSPDDNPNIQPTANISTLAQQTASNGITFLHAATGYPVLSTWLAAIDQGFYTTWPGLTARAVRQHLPKSVTTAIGHLDQQRANRHSTKTKPSPTATPNNQPILPSRTNQIFVDCRATTSQIFSDLPRRFLIPPSRGNNYLLIVCDVDSHTILAKPIKN
jgi:hypothetical protein